MTSKEVSIKLVSRQSDGNTKEETELISAGLYEATEKGYRISYEESEATGFEGSVTTLETDTHTVNAIGLIQDSDCHRKYILQIYDNNYPGETKQLYIQKLPKCKLKIDSNGKATVVGTTFEYSATYEGKQVGIEFSDVTAH